MTQPHSKFDFIPSAYIGTCEIEKEIVVKGIPASEVLLKSVNTLGSIVDEGDYLKINKPLQITGQIKSEPAEFNLDLTYLSDDDHNNQVVTLAWIKQFMVSLGYFSGGTPGSGDAVAISADLLKYIDDRDALRMLTADAINQFAGLSEFVDFKSSTGRQLTNLNSLLNGQVEDIEHKFVIQDQYNSTLYNKQAVDGLLGAKASTSDLTASQTSLNNALATKLDVSAFNSFQTQNTNTINMKHSIADFNTYVTATAVILASKLATSDFNAFQTTNTSAINSKVSSSDYMSFLTSNTAALNLKLDTSTYTANKTSTDNSIATKAPQNTTYTKTETDGKVSAVQSALDAYKTTNDPLVNSKLDTGVFNSYKSVTDSLITTKAPQSTTYTKTETDGKVSAVQSALDAYKTTNDTAVASRVTNATFQAYDATVTNNFVGIQNQVAQRVKITDFEDFRISNKSYIDAAQASLLAGPGLTRADNIFSVNADQPGITSVGTLANLTVAGSINPGGYTIIPYNSGSESLRFTRPDGGNAQGLIGFDVTTARPQLNIKNLSGSGVISVQTAANGIVNFEGGPVNINSGNDALTSTTGALKVAGGISVAKSLFIAGGIRQDATSASTMSLGGMVTFSVDYPNTTGGRLVLDNNGDFFLNRGIMSILNTTDSTTAGTGALRVAGGASITKSLYVGSSVVVPGSAAQGYMFGAPGTNGIAQISTAGQFFTNGVINDIIIRNTAASLRLGISNGNSNLDILTTSGNILVNTTTESTSSTTGALQVQGGVGVVKNANIGGNATITGTLTALNVKSAQIPATFSQSGVTWTNVTLSVCNYSKVGRNVTASYEFVWENQSGNANGQFTFSLPFQSKNSTVMRGVQVGDGNSYATNSGMVDYLCKFSTLGNNAVLYSNLATNLAAGSGSGGISFTIYYYANS